MSQGVVILLILPPDLTRPKWILLQELHQIQVQIQIHQLRHMIKIVFSIPLVSQDNLQMLQSPHLRAFLRHLIFLLTIIHLTTSTNHRHPNNLFIISPITHHHTSRNLKTTLLHMMDTLTRIQISSLTLALQRVASLQLLLITLLIIKVLMLPLPHMLQLLNIILVE